MSRPTTLEQDQGAAIVDAWNAHHPVGTPVVLVDDLGRLERTKTRTPAWCLGHGEPVVSVEGRSGGFMLSRIIPEARPGFQIRFDGPPGPDGPRFIEVETLKGVSFSLGEWCEGDDGEWLLVVRNGGPEVTGTRGASSATGSHGVALAAEEGGCSESQQ